MQYEGFIEDLESVCQYARAELASHSWDRFAQLPKLDVNGFKKLVKLAKSVYVIVHSHRRHPTWSAVCRGANLYRS